MPDKPTSTNQENEMFITRDLYLATTLSTLRFFNTSIDFQYEGSRNTPVGYFNFENTKELQDAVNQYWRGELAIEPRMFINNLKSLKSQLTSVYKNPHNNPRKY